MRGKRNERLLRHMGLHKEEKRLGLDVPGDMTPETWFIGPKAENADLLKRLVDMALEHNFESRRQYMRHDPRMFEEGKSYPHSEDRIARELDHMLHWLRGSVPLSSFRNLSHMYWDQSLPAIAGYIAALLYNQNNVAAEASPVTTLLEIEVGDDLCRMLGYHIPSKDEIAAGVVKPWGHLTCDGSVANGESIWASRNLKYGAVALAASLSSEEALAPSRNVSVRLLDGKRARLADLDAWQLLNLPIDEMIALPQRVAHVGGLDQGQVEAALARHSVQALGLVEFHRRYLADVQAPVLMAPQTAHYSWPKFVSMVGLGRKSLVPVQVDRDGRMDMVALRRELDRCLDERRPVMQVTAVLGTTEESAVDPLSEILSIRDEYRAFGLEFSVHVDAAWGGYFASMLRVPSVAGTSAPNEVESHQSTRRESLRFPDGHSAPGIIFNPFVERQFRALGRADSITVDPHKAGFIPYPAGALCYRNGAMRDFISFKAAVVYHGGIDPTVGVYGIEGSKPGAAAAATYLSHKVIRTDQSGYGDLLARCIFNSKRFYAALTTLTGPDFTVTPFQRLPSEKLPGATAADIAAERDTLSRRIVPLDDTALLQVLRNEPHMFRLFRDIGPDLTITTYSFNFISAAGVNTDLALLNEMNDMMYRHLSLQSFDGGFVPTTQMFVTASDFDPANYGQPFVDAFARRCGVEPVPGMPISFLISTTQNPWLSEAGSGGMLRTLMKVLAQTASNAAQTVMQRHGISPAGSQ